MKMHEYITEHYPTKKLTIKDISNNYSSNRSICNLTTTFYKARRKITNKTYDMALYIIDVKFANKLDF